MILIVVGRSCIDQLIAAAALEAGPRGSPIECDGQRLATQGRSSLFCVTVHQHT